MDADHVSLGIHNMSDKTKWKDGVLGFFNVATCRFDPASFRGAIFRTEVNHGPLET